MIPVLYPQSIASKDRSVIESLGITEAILVENAARSVLEVLNRLIESEGFGVEVETLILCGPGNNGADGLALARQLAGSGRPVSVLLCRDEESLNSQCRFQLGICRELQEISIRSIPDTGLDELQFDAPIIVDAMLGTGATGELRDPFDRLVQLANRVDALRIAVDIPTGLDGADGRAQLDCFAADVTVTMGAIKPGLLLNDGPQMSGDLFLSNLSLPSRLYSDEIFLLERGYAGGGLPTFGRQDHKYDRGSLLVVAGSRRMTGAAALAALSPLRLGTGLVTVAVPEEAHDGLRSMLPPEIMTLPLASEKGWFTEESFEGLKDRIGSFDAIVAGPGIGSDHGQRSFLKLLAESSRLPLLLDADGLHPEIIERALSARNVDEPVVITPHHGEMARLVESGSDEIGLDPIGTASRYAGEKNLIVVLKGAPTIVSDARRSLVNSAGNPGMATAGAGDVLAGVLGGMLAGSSEGTWLDRVATGVWLHSHAADLALGETGTVAGLTSSTIAEYTGRALADLSGWDQQEDS